MTTPLKQAVSEAATWFARFAGDNVTEREVEQWQTWLAQSSLNQQAWQQIEQVQQTVRQVPGQLAAPTLLKTSFSRRALLTRLGVLSMAVPLAGWQLYQLPWQRWQAGYQTAIGEQQVITLADSTKVTLNTGTAMDVSFSKSERLLTVYDGEIYVHTSHQSNETRPFFVQTAQGRMQALGTQFSVRTVSGKTLLHVIENTVRILPGQYLQQTDVSAGQQVWFSATQQGKLESSAKFADSWRHGSLMVVDMPLRTVLAELSRYRHGYLGCDDGVADLKISGAFPLTDTDAALHVLAASFPLKIRQISRFWIRLEAAG